MSKRKNSEGKLVFISLDVVACFSSFFFCIKKEEKQKIQISN